MTETYTWEQRHERGLEAINTLIAGRVDPERAARSNINRNGALGQFTNDFVAGDVWWRPGLSRRDRSLIVLAMLAANARHRETRFHVQAGINHGLSREEIEEIMLHVALYAGWPVASESMGEITEVFREIDGVDRYPKRAPAERKDDAQRRHDGAAVAHSILGGRSPLDGEQALAMTSEQLGPVGQLALEFAFGEVWARPQLSKRDRSLATVAVLVATAGWNELKGHIHGALNHGCTPEELTELMVQGTVYAGFPKAVEGMRTLKQIVARRDERATAAKGGG